MCALFRFPSTRRRRRRRDPGRAPRSGPARLLLSALLALAWSAPLSGQPEGYSLVEPPPLPDSLFESHAEGRFTITVSRATANRRERELLRIAESLLPDAAVIEAAVTEHLVEIDSAGRWPLNFEEARGIPGDRWWWLDFGGLLPFALHGRAVDHYIDFVRSEARRAGGSERGATLRYRALVTDMPGEGGFRVTLSLSVSTYCGSLCGFGFDHQRIVVFDESGRVTSVQGDARPRAWIS